MHTKKLWMVLFFLCIGVLTVTVWAEVSIPQQDRTPINPLAALPASASPRYISGFGQNNAYTLFYEDRNDRAGCAYGSRVYFIQTTDGPANFSAPVRTDICDTHFVVKDWPVTYNGTTYAYRGWASVGNNHDHNFYVSNDLVHWQRFPFTFHDPDNVGGGGEVYYGFHDIIRINGHYMGFAELNLGRTVIVWSEEGTDNWIVKATVGGMSTGPLNLGFPGSSGPTPTGNFLFVEVNGEVVLGKLSVPGDNSAAYWAINRAVTQAATPAEAEAAFLDPSNWTWSDGSTGLPADGLKVLSETAERDVREVWNPPPSDPHLDPVIFYTARYTSQGGSDLGCASSAVDCKVYLPTPTPAPTFTPTPPGIPSALPATGFRRGQVQVLPQQPQARAYEATGMTLEIPRLGVSAVIVGVPRARDGWDVSWLGNRVGYLEGSAFPTWAGNTVLTGHVWDAYNRPGVFRNLRALRYGDKILIRAWGLTYTYEVHESRLLWPGSVQAVMKHEGLDWVTLVTCEFYNPLSGRYLFRRMVRAVLVGVK